MPQRNQQPTHPAAASPWMNLAEVVEYIGLGERTCRRMVATGDLPAYRVSKRQLRFKRSDVDALMKPVPTTGTAS